MKKKKLKQIIKNLSNRLSKLETKQTVDIPKLREPFLEDSKLVPYNTICACNPFNGGSGICGCVIGNTMVSKNAYADINFKMLNKDAEDKHGSN